MRGSYQIGTAFGIPVRVHASFLLVLALFWSEPWALIALFGSVLLHELGHSLVAQRYGVRVLDITLWPLGGMARLTAMPEVPRVDALVALAGPAVNAVLAGFAGCGFVLALLYLPPAAGIFQALFLVNVVLGVFNLLPAFPMDGGRVLRAWLARRRDWVSATELAVRVGRWLALAMIVAPLVARALPGSGPLLCSLPIVGVFVLFAGLQELVAVRLRHGLGPLGGRFASFSRVWPADMRAGSARATPVGAREPVDGGEPADARATGSSSRRAPAHDAGEPEGARRPAHWDGLPTSSGRGWDEGRIRELERFRGRLRQPGSEA